MRLSPMFPFALLLIGCIDGLYDFYCISLHAVLFTAPRQLFSALCSFLKVLLFVDNALV